MIALKPKSRTFVCLMLCAAAGAQAQSSCSSDGQPQPIGLLERFINADCEPCWRHAQTLRPGRGELALDWVAPGSRGEDAPLSLVAVREALVRLQGLGMTRPLMDAASRQKAHAGKTTLRVAHGFPFGGYIGTSMELKPDRGGPWQAWLLLVEVLPAGTEGSPVERTLVRNVLQLTWDAKTPRDPARQGSLYESRPMQIPAGADPARLRVVGWIEDARGRLRGIAASRCAPALGKG